MKISPDFFSATQTKYQSKLYWRFKLHLVLSAGYNGEIVQSEKEIADLLHTSVYRTRLLFRRALEEGLLVKEDGIIRCTSVQEYDENSLYAKAFSLMTHPDFLAERMVLQRFVIHYVGAERVYNSGAFRWGKVSELVGEHSVFGVKTKKDALRLLEDAQRYLHIEVSKNEESFKVTGIQPYWYGLGTLDSIGSLLWTRFYLQEAFFAVDFIQTPALIALTKVIQFYMTELGYETTRTLVRAAFQSMSGSHAPILALIHQSEALTEEEERQISAYFRTVMKEKELFLFAQNHEEMEREDARVQRTMDLLTTHVSLQEVGTSLLHRFRNQYMRLSRKQQELEDHWIKKWADYRAPLLSAVNWLRKALNTSPYLKTMLQNEMASLSPY